MKSTQNLSTNTVVNFSRPKTNDLDFSKTARTHSSFSKATHSRSTYAFISSITIGSAAFLFGLTYGLICPAIQPDSISAESASTEVTASIDDIIAISAPTSASITITPKADSSTFATTSVDVSVTTNNAYGYQLSMGTSGTDSSGSLTTSLIENTISTSSSTISIPSITTSISGITTSSYDDFTDNSWGFTTNNNGTDTSTGQIVANTYEPLTTTASPTLIKSTDTTATSDTTTVTFATKINKEQPAGTYTNTVVFSATANPKPTTIFDISTMQEITATICNNTTTPDAVTGDDVKYDTNESHYGDSAYVPQATLIDTRDNTEYTIVKLADGNCWMQENLALGTSDSAGLTLTSATSDVSSDWTLPAYDSIGTTWDNTDSTAHVIQGSTTASSSWTSGMGNWYTYNTATAGTGTSLTSGDATDSICPKGWQLSVTDSSLSAGDFTSTLDKSFGNLFRIYGATSSSSTTSTLIRSAPLSFTYAGNYNFRNGVATVGSSGHYWSSTASSDAYIYNLYFNSSTVSPQDNVSRGNGRSVRCVAH